MPRIFSVDFYRQLKLLFVRVTELEAENTALKARVLVLEEAAG